MQNAQNISDFFKPRRKHSIVLPDKLKIKINYETIYLATYFIYVFISILDTSLLEISIVMKIVKLFSIAVMLLLFIVKRRYNLYEMLTAGLIVTVFAIAAHSTDRTYIWIYSLFIINSGCCKFDNIVKCSVISTTISIILVVTLSKLGILPDYLFTHNELTAHSLGFPYYSTVPFALMYAMLGYLYLKKENISYIGILTLQILNFGIYLLTTTRLPFFLFIIITVFYVIIVKWKILKFGRKWIANLLTLIFPISFGVTVWAAKHYTIQQKFWRQMDDILNGRLEQEQLAFKQYPVQLFGQYIEMQGNVQVITWKKYFYIDSGFVYAILGYGVVFTVIILLIYSILTRWAYLQKDSTMLVWLLAVMLFSVVNNTWIGITYNPALLYFFVVMQQFLSQKFVFPARRQ